MITRHSPGAGWTDVDVVLLCLRSKIATQAGETASNGRTNAVPDRRQHRMGRYENTEATRKRAIRAVLTGARWNRAKTVGRPDCSLAAWQPRPLKSDREREENSINSAQCCGVIATKGKALTHGEFVAERMRSVSQSSKFPV